VIRREFGVRYHRDHVRKILHRLGFSFVGLGKKMASGRKESRPRWIRKHRVGRRG
jgi:transposase